MRMTSRWERLVPVAFAVFPIGAGGARPPLIDAAETASATRGARCFNMARASTRPTGTDDCAALGQLRDDLESADLLIRAAPT
jgi:hypothetical protein